MKSSLLGRLFYLVLVISLIQVAHLLHVEGTWNSEGFFLFLAKFGFQKTTLEDKRGTRGYIYGNVTSLDSSNQIDPPATLVVVDSEYFLELFGNGSQMPHDGSGRSSRTCDRMFSKLEKLAWHPRCNPQGKEDFLRSVPCSAGKLCSEEDDPVHVVPGAQLTYAIEDVHIPRFWYVSLVSCRRRRDSCHWEATHRGSTTQSLRFDLWLVNGPPHLRGANGLEHQFSFEQHDLVELFAVFSILNLSLAAFVTWSWWCLKWKTISGERSSLAAALAAYSWTEALAAMLALLHLIVFAANGYGLQNMWHSSQVARRWADAIFLLILLVTARYGFQSRPDPYGVIATLCVFLTVSTGFFFWALNEVQPVLDVGIWDTVPGCLLIASRFAVIFWFLVELRGSAGVATMENGKYNDGLSHTVGPQFGEVDVLHFAAGYLLWFLTLPILVLIAETRVSSLWREKVILSVDYSVNFVAASSMAYLMHSANKHGGRIYTRAPMN